MNVSSNVIRHVAGVEPCELPILVCMMAFVPVCQRIPGLPLVQHRVNRAPHRTCCCSAEASSSQPGKDVEVGWLWASGKSAATSKVLKKRGFKPKK